LRFTPGLRAFTLATLVALTGVSALSSPVAAADPAATVQPAAAASVTPAATLATTPAPVTVALVVAPAPAPRSNLGARIVSIALAQVHKRYRYGSAGPSAFDCSGLVRYAYRQAGVSNVLGGGHSALAMYRWARAHNLASSGNPQLGDVVVYGGGTHVGIYIGRGLVVSALNPRLGIRVTSLRGLTSRFTTFIHTRI
jgi:cell wall-associated NlpC family hydrolase